jgi:hypothetical protein
VIFERAALLLLGLTSQIDPEMNPIRTVGPYLEQFVLGGEEGPSWQRQLGSSLREMALSAIALPDKANRFFDRADGGEIRIHIPEIRESALLLYAGVHQALSAFLGAVTGGLAYALTTRGDRIPGTIAWVVSAVCFAVMFASILRAKSLRRVLRARVPK